MGFGEILGDLIKGIYIFFWVSIITIALLVGYILYGWWNPEKPDWQTEAVKDGVGQFYYDVETGERKFEWLRK